MLFPQLSFQTILCIRFSWSNLLPRAVAAGEQRRAQGERVCEPRWEIRAQTSPTPAVCVEQKELLERSVTGKLTVPVGSWGAAQELECQGLLLKVPPNLGPCSVRCHSPGAASGLKPNESNRWQIEAANGFVMKTQF